MNISLAIGHEGDAGADKDESMHFSIDGAGAGGGDKYNHRQ